MVSADDIFDELKNSFLEPNARKRRRFLPGLLISFIDLLRYVDGTGGRYATLDALYEDFPRNTVTSGGGQANILILTTDKTKGTTQSIRPFYENFARWLRIDNKRLDYPKAAPHATQAWSGYTHWLEGLLQLTDAELEALEKRTKDFVLAELPSHIRDTSTLKREPLRFSLFLDDFDLKYHKGETSGAAYQGTVFGYIRADAAHLQVETARVRSGGKRENRVGDIDALNGDNLVISVEVKQYVIAENEVADFEDFATQVARENALGLVVALDFAEGVRESLREMGLEPMSKQDLQGRVRLWDALKQRVAVDALVYYVTRIEQNTALRERVNAFFAEIEGKISLISAVNDSDGSGLISTEPVK